MNETAQKQPEPALKMADLLNGAAAREAASSSGDILPQLASARSAGSISAARQVVPSIDGHFTKSADSLSSERRATDEMINKLEAELQNDMAVFVDLSNRINVRTEQLARLRNHKTRLTMAATLHSIPPQQPSSAG